MYDYETENLMNKLFDMKGDEQAWPVAGWMRPRFGKPAKIGQTKLFLADCDPQSASEVAQSVQRFYDDFPHVAAGLRTVEVADIPDGAYAGTQDWHDGTFDIVLGRKVYGKGRRWFLEERVAEDYACGFHRFIRPTGNFEHELGHVLDLSLMSHGARRLGPSDARDISGYAMRGGPEEAIAEVFANWREGIRHSRYVEDVLGSVIRAANSPQLAAAA